MMTTTFDSPIGFAPPEPPPAPPPAAEPWEPFDLDLPDLELEDAEPAAAAATTAVDIDVRGGFQGLPGDPVRARVGSRADAAANARKVLLEKRTPKKDKLQCQFDGLASAWDRMHGFEKWRAR